jgi:hypothetical protein
VTALLESYGRLRNSAQLSQAQADEIVAAARPMALAALGRQHDPPDSLNVVALEVATKVARGGSLIPAWPTRVAGEVTIEFVADWGAMLAAWRSLIEPGEQWVDDLLRSGQRTWVGIANDVLQLFVPDPPPGCYSMVRHHALMLVAATLWLGSDSTQRWQAAHALAARAFLRSLNGEDVWSAVERAEHGLNLLLANPLAHEPARSVVDWLDRDVDAGARYTAYLGAASLGVAALLESEPVWIPERLADLICNEHPKPDFNRLPIERFAQTANA